MVDEKRADKTRKALRIEIARQVGPMAMFIFDAIIGQYPKGNNIDGWFMPDHKGIMREKKLNHSAYYYLVFCLVDKGFLERGRRMFGSKRGIWYRINWEKLGEMSRAL